MRFLAGLVALLGTVTLPSSALAGPPYVTDDPEPVEYRHWEVYLASLIEHDSAGWTGTSPHVEVNYGVVRDVQLHVVAPLAFAVLQRGSARLGPGDTELGIKWRFLEESERIPQIGAFPLFEIPTGGAGSALGNGSLQVFLPLWIQKTVGPVTSYGGGGVWLNARPGTLTWVYLGWQAQWHLLPPLALGAEVFYESPKTPGGESEGRLNLGLLLDISAHHHILWSAGRGFVGPNLLQAYFAWLVTFGPE